ncbi:MAG TPA: class I SAM-dependent methyltransferase family protein [Candidatus Thermoplasmatota archaeon]|nr:class I SAM-dependent methyltransferase family protein [Candidatus Thermoplasmatota archaeon]
MEALAAARRATPFERIDTRLGTVLEPSERAQLPRKWELYGDVLVLRLPAGLHARGREVAEAYAKELMARTVLEDVGGVQGEHREPRMRLLHGTGTETVHREDGLSFAFDVARLMYSSGNNYERKRMGKVVRAGERVVDLFAGIGYFTLPMARAGAHVRAIERNPVAHGYLVENVRRNGLSDRVEAVLGDCREAAPVGVADRVLLGYLGDTRRFLPTAMRALAPGGGALHYHDACPVEAVPARPLEEIAAAARDAGRTLASASTRVVKSYAPGVVHFVTDAVVR